MRLQRIPYAELMGAGWELHHPRMLIRFWKGSRHDSAPRLLPRQRAEFNHPDDSHSLVRSVRTDSLDETAIGEEYANLGREFALAPNFDILAMSGKIRLLRDRRIEPTRILKFLDPVAKRGTVRAFSGSLRPAASGVQS